MKHLFVKMDSKMLKHLRSRPVAPIVDASIDKFNNTNALKIMCIIDYELQRSQLYLELEATPKLMKQLLNIYTFTPFKYFKYNLTKDVNIHGKILKCKNCEIIGPYSTILEHMAICHNIHASAKMCMWCEKMDFKAHNSSNSMHQCYENYLKNFSSIQYPGVIEKFYDLLKKVAAKIRTNIRRSKDFKNTMNAISSEKIPIDQADDSMSSDILVFKPKKYPNKGKKCSNIYSSLILILILKYRY